MTQVLENPSIEEFMEHYGVLGMHWGVTRARATSRNVRSSRNQITRKREALNKKSDQVHRNASGTPARKAGTKELAKMRMDYLKDPDRVTAARMTTGEKVAIALFLTPVAAAAAIAGTSARSRRIEYKQLNNCLLYTSPSPRDRTR